MSCTIVIPNRNRDLAIVSKTLEALAPQLNEANQATIVDYGSTIAYQNKLTNLCEGSLYINLLLCPTQQQLWHKTRAINMVLKQCETTHFIVLDMDCMVHPLFIEKAVQLCTANTCINFPYGFLDKEESKRKMAFKDYTIDFVGSLTGTLIARTEDLLAIQGYDEFYHNWGAEDADILGRLERHKVDVTFFDSEVLLLHQWHPKAYRSKESLQPYHNHLEQINQQYFELGKTFNATRNSASLEWGVKCELADYETLEKPTLLLTSNNEEAAIKALLASLKVLEKGTCLHLIINEQSKKPLKNALKKVLDRKIIPILDLERVNEALIELIITHYRNCPYAYLYHRDKGEIVFKILIT